jgi:phosphatidylglycerophosphatase C
MNVYDFDGTIYRRDSSVDFILYCLEHQPSLIALAPRFAAAAIRHAAGRIDKTQMKQSFFSFLQRIDDPETAVERFWEGNIDNMHAWYADRHRPDDAVVSASPEFLLRIPCERLEIPTLIASRVDERTGAFDGENCHGAEKVRRFREVFPDARVEEFYSDSFSDEPMARIAERAYLVRGERLEPWPE